MTDAVLYPFSPLKISFQVSVVLFSEDFGTYYALEYMFSNRVIMQNALVIVFVLRCVPTLLICRGRKATCYKGLYF